MSEMNSSQKIRAYRQSLIGKKVSLVVIGDEDISHLELIDWADGWLLVRNLNSLGMQWLLNERSVRAIWTL